MRLHPALRAHIYSDLRIRSGQMVRSALRLSDLRQETARLPNHAFYLRPAFAEGLDDRKEEIRRKLLTLHTGFHPADLRYLAANAGLIAQILAYRLSLKRTSRLAYLVVVCEQLPNRDSRVVLSHEKGCDGYHLARADWRLCARDFASVEALYELLVGGGLDPRVFEALQRREDLRWHRRLTSAAHHLGTCRMASTPSTGVVDHNLKVFDTENLYICDGSVFSTTGNANSTLTAAALALRLGTHLARRMRASLSRPAA